MKKLKAKTFETAEDTLDLIIVVPSLLSSSVPSLIPVDQNESLEQTGLKLLSQTTAGVEISACSEQPTHEDNWFQQHLLSEIDFSSELGSQQSLKQQNPAKLLRCMTNYPPERLKAPKKLIALLEIQYAGYRASRLRIKLLEEKNATYEHWATLNREHKEKKLKELEEAAAEIELQEKNHLDEIAAVIREIRKVR
jgi:hypothetical protein